MTACSSKRRCRLLADFFRNIRCTNIHSSRRQTSTAGPTLAMGGQNRKSHLLSPCCVLFLKSALEYFSCVLSRDRVPKFDNSRNLKVC
jgi:hypothetical protein